MKIKHMYIFVYNSYVVGISELGFHTSIVNSSNDNFHAMLAIGKVTSYMIIIMLCYVFLMLSA